MGNPFLKIIQDPTESEFLKTAKKLRDRIQIIREAYNFIPQSRSSSTSQSGMYFASSR